MTGPLEPLDAAHEAGGGGVTVTVDGITLQGPAVTTMTELGDLPAKIVARDATVWGPDAAAEAAVRLGWLDAVETGRRLVPQITALREALAGEGVDRVVLCGMGGSSLAPEVLCATYAVPLTVVDTTDPGQIASALVELERTVVVVSSKSGGTLETDSHRRAARAAFHAAGIDPAQRIVVVTDPGSPFEQAAREEGSREVFLADPDVGGRYSALTAFGLVPAGLAGVDLTALLEDAAAVQPTLADAAGPAFLLGAALGGGAVAGRDKLVLLPSADLPGFGDWAEQLIAESTGKQGTGLLPVVVESASAAGTEAATDLHLLVAGSGGAPDGPHTTVTGPLGGQFLVWELATAVAGAALRIDPFDQPNVQESKDNTSAILDGDDEPTGEPSFSDGAVQVYGDASLLGAASDLAGALQALLAAVPDRGYLAVMAYLDRHADARAQGLRALLAARLAHPVTFGWAPRFLHSTGQFHKGGPQTGAYLQVTGTVAQDLAIPGRPFSFGRLQQAQWQGDLRALAQRDRPVLRLHLTDRAAGLEALLEAAGSGVSA